jgi:hypothetical protein
LFCCRAEICTSVLHKAKSSLNLADKAVLQICEAFRLDRAFRDNPGITFYIKGLCPEMVSSFFLNAWIIHPGPWAFKLQKDIF